MELAGDIHVLLERLARVQQNDAYRGDLNPTQWEILRYLARANRFSRSPSAVTAYLGMTKGTVSQSLNTLVRKKLVLKEMVVADRRNRRLEVTDKAISLLSDDPLTQLLQSLSRLSSIERRQLENGLHKILTDALNQRGGRPFGVCKTCRFFRANTESGTPHRCELLRVALTHDDSQRICIEQESRVGRRSLAQ